MSYAARGANEALQDDALGRPDRAARFEVAQPNVARDENDRVELGEPATLRRERDVSAERVPHERDGFLFAARVCTIDHRG